MNVKPSNTLEGFLTWCYSVYISNDAKLNKQSKATKTNRTHQLTKEEFKPIVDLFKDHHEHIKKKLHECKEDCSESWTKCLSEIVREIPTKLLVTVNETLAGIVEDSKTKHSSPDVYCAVVFQNKIDTMVLLKMNLSSDVKPVYFVTHKVSVICNDKPTSEDIEKINKENQEFYKGTCPSNWLSCKVLSNGDSDPHWLFEHVQTILSPSDKEEKEINYNIQEAVKTGFLNPDTVDFKYEKMKALFSKLETLD